MHIIIETKFGTEDTILQTLVKRRLNSLSANPKKWSNTLKQLVGNLPTNCLNVFDHFWGLTLNGLNDTIV